MSKRNIFSHKNILERASLRSWDGSFGSDVTAMSTKASESSIDSPCRQRKSLRSSNNTSETTTPKYPQTKKRGSFLARTLSRMSSFNSLLNDDDYDEGLYLNSLPEYDRVAAAGRDEGLLGSSDTDTSFDIDAELSSFDMALKARSLLADIRERLKQQRQEEQNIRLAVSRMTELALARGNSAGALIALKKARKLELMFKRIHRVIGYLETHETDLMSDIEEFERSSSNSTNTNSGGINVFEWSEYANVEVEVENILSGANDRGMDDSERDWTEEALLQELENLRQSEGLEHT